MINRIISGILVVISIILGIIVSLFFAHGFLPCFRNITKFNLFLGFAFIAVLTITTLASYFLKNKCLKATLIAPGILLLIASIGSIITSSLALSINICPNKQPVIVLVGFVASFAAIMILTFCQFIISLIYRSTDI